MGEDVILYDRIWLGRYIENVEYQADLLRSIKYNLQRERKRALPELQINFDRLLVHIAELERSLETTGTALKDYLNNVQSAAIRFQKQCQEIQLPDFYYYER